jgi:hypothetical protein
VGAGPPSRVQDLRHLGPNQRELGICLAGDVFGPDAHRGARSLEELEEHRIRMADARMRDATVRDPVEPEHFAKLRRPTSRRDFVQEADHELAYDLELLDDLARRESSLRGDHAKELAGSVPEGPEVLAPRSEQERQERHEHDDEVVYDPLDSLALAEPP